MSPEKRVKIITDSTARIPKEISEKYDIGVARLNINVLKDGKLVETFKDGVDIDESGYVKKLEDKQLDIKTSAPNLGEIVNLFEASKDREAIFIHLGTKFSPSTDQAANVAKNSGDYNNVTIYDTENVCLIKNQVINAAILANQGKSVKEITDSLDRSKKRSVLFVALDKLDHLKKGGRANNVQALYMTLTGKKLVLEVRNNLIEKFELERGIDSAINLMENVAMSLKPQEICLFHGGDKEFEQKAIKATKEMASRTNNKINVDYDYAGPLLTAHTGSKVIGLGIFSEDPMPAKIIFKA